VILKKIWRNLDIRKLPQIFETLQELLVGETARFAGA
jgi:hypothetical protein